MELIGSAAAADYSDGGEAGGADRSLGNTDSYDLTLLTNNIERLRIQEGGKIGIGLVSPFAVTTAQELLHLGDISANEPGIRCESFDAGDGSSATTIDMYASSNNAKIVSSRSLHFDYGAPDTMIFSRAGTQAFRVSTNMGLVIGDDLTSTTSDLHIIPTNDLDGNMTIDTTWYDRESKMTFHRPSGAGNAEANWRVGMTTAASGQFGWKESISGGGGAGTDVMTLSIDGDLAVNSTFQASAYNIVSHEGDVQTYEDEVQTLVT